MKLYSKFLCCFLVILLLTSFGFTSFADSPVAAYSDVTETAWYYEPVMALSAEGIIQGVGNGKFAPNETVSRAMAVTIIYRIAGCPDASSLENPFTDVPDDKWFTDAVKWAAANEITNGMTETSFAPYAPVTREQLACFVFRYGNLIHARITAPLEYAPYGVALALYDEDQISPFAKEACSRMIRRGIFTGNHGYLYPHDPCTRAEAVTVLYRFKEGLDKFGTYDPLLPPPEPDV